LGYGSLSDGPLSRKKLPDGGKVLPYTTTLFYNAELACHSRAA
jgi:hypothetical protein